MRPLLALLLLNLSAAVVAAPLRLEGEVFARNSAVLSPPAVDGMWQFNLTFLVPDGTPVAQGAPVLGFDATQLESTLQQKRSALAEKISLREKLHLELAERERNEQLATEQARAGRDKAQRKATQPEELLRRVDYQKLVVERQQNERLFELAQRRERLAAEQRRHETQALNAEIAQLEREVAAAQQSLTELKVMAPRDGVVLHRSSWNGEKFEVGSQVWRGQSVAELPDRSTLAVRAQLAEIDYLRLRDGDPVRVQIEGSGYSLDGQVESVGRIVRSKSRLQPVPVIDVVIALQGDTEKLKPGQAVRVDLLKQGDET